MTTRILCDHNSTRNSLWFEVSLHQILKNSLLFLVRFCRLLIQIIYNLFDFRLELEAARLDSNVHLILFKKPALIYDSYQNTRILDLDTSFLLNVHSMAKDHIEQNGIEDGLIIHLEEVTILQIGVISRVRGEF